MPPEELERTQGTDAVLDEAYTASADRLRITFGCEADNDRLLAILGERLALRGT